MNTKRFIMCALTIALLPLGLAIAQPADGPGMGPGQGPGRMGRHQRPDGPGRGAGILQMYDRITKALPTQLELTPEQVEKFKILVTKNRTELEEIVKKLEAQRTKFDADLNVILTPEQQTKLKELKERKEKMMKEFRPGMGQGRGEGMGKGRGAGRPGPMLKAIEELNLPPERAAKAQEILKNSRERFTSAPRGDREARMKIMKEMMTQLEEVLTPEEVKKVKETMRSMRPAGPRGERGPMGKGPGRQQRGMKGQGKGQAPKDCPPTPAPDDSNESLW